MLECSDATLYTGIARDVKARLKAHNGGVSGAKYTRSRRPVRLVYTEVCPDKSGALSRERQIKKLSRAQKLALLSPNDTKLMHPFDIGVFEPEAVFLGDSLSDI
ncbi:MAG: GIY-YIG nuclease family protein [Campylobacterales bacterium]|nr:GIY-YIG nuclease family protein [Campylobacterales bacterium]